MPWRNSEPLTEADLLSAALALLGKRSGLSVPEAALVAGIAKSPDKALVKRLRAAIAEGVDPLGDTFCRLRNADARRAHGQTFTPPGIVASMIARAQAEVRADGPFALVVDGGAGTGRFTLAAGRAFPDAALVAVEPDPVCAVLLRANLAAAGMANRATVLVGDYREVPLPSASGRRLFIGNPPYVRHHDIAAVWKDWYSATMRGLGAEKASKLAGLHLHFFARVGEIAEAGDVGIFVTAAEWTDTNYGAALRSTLCGRLGGVSVHVVDAKAEPFPGVLTTAAITVFKPHRGTTSIRLHAVASIEDLRDLAGGVARPAADLAQAKRWQVPSSCPAGATVHVLEVPSVGTRVGDLFRVSRGQVTGANAVWIAGEQAKRLPKRFLVPCITGASELFAASAAGGRLERVDHLERVVDLPRDLRGLSRAERAAIDAFLTWAEKAGGKSNYVATHRNPWWAVRLPAAAPIVCTYMARRPPVFVRNIGGACLLNVAHGLYPLAPMSDAELDDACRSLNRASNLNAGRVYAGGLTKFEPGAVEDMVIDWTPQRWLEAAE